MHVLAFIIDVVIRAMRRTSRPPLSRIGAVLMLATFAGAAPAQEGDRSASFPGAIAMSPLNERLREAVLESIRSQLLDASRAEIRFLVHFPLQRGDNGRVCGEVREPGAAGARVRTFFSIYTRAGRVLTRLEDGAFEAYLAQDTVFRNCSPRL
jgi:hypothetical protein